jgi:uncharacterized protein YjbJ (UPF0337 family)
MIRGEDRIKPMANYIKGRLKERHGNLLWEGIFSEGEGNAQQIFWNLKRFSGTDFMWI